MTDQDFEFLTLFKNHNRSASQCAQEDEPLRNARAYFLAGYSQIREGTRILSSVYNPSNVGEASVFFMASAAELRLLNEHLIQLINLIKIEKDVEKTPKTG